MERNKRSNKYQSIYFFPTIIILLLGVVIFFGIRERVEGALATQYEALFARLEEEFAIKAAYDSITFHSINIVQLRDVFLEWQGNSVVAESIALRINPLSFRAQNPLGVIRAINLNKLHMTLDLDRLTEFNDVVSDGTSESESVVDIDATLHDIGDLFRHATISITNTSLIMKSGAMNYGVDNINVAIDFSEDLLRYEGECIAHIYSAQPVTLPLFLWESDTRMRVMLAGDYVFDRAYSESTIMLADIEAGGFALQPLEFQLRYQNKSIALNSATPLQPLQIALTYDVEEQLLVSDVVSLGVNYDQLIVEGRSAIQIPDILRNYYTFSFSVEYNASADILSYRADLNATRQAKDVLTLNMQGDRTQLFVNNAVLFAPVGQAMLRGGVDLLQRTMEGSLQFDQFAIMDSNLINGTFEIRAADESITDIVSTNFIIGDIALPLIRATAQLLPTLNAFDALIAFDREQNEIASFAFNNNIAAQTDEYTASFVDVSLRDLVKIGKNIAPQQLMSVSDALVEDLYLNASANIYREAGDVLISLPLLSVLNRPSSFEILSMRAAGTSEIVDVEEIVIHARDMSLQGFASMKNIADQTYDVNIVLAGARERYDLDVRYRHRQFARLTSSRGVSAVLLFLPNERLRYIMEFSSFPLYIGNIEFALDLASQGDFQSAEIWNFNVDTLDLVEIASSSGTRRRATANGNDAATYAFGHRIPYSLNASFGATPQGVSFQEFVVQDNTASFEGNGGLSFMSEEECREAAYGVVLASAQSAPLANETACLNFEFKSDRLNERILTKAHWPRSNPVDFALEVTFKQLNLRHIPQNVFRGGIDCTLTAGTRSLKSDASVADNNSIEFHATVQECRFVNATMGSRPFNFEIGMDINSDRINVNTIRADYLGYAIENRTFVYDLIEQDLDVEIMLIQNERLSILPSSPNVVVEQVEYPLIEAFIAVRGDVGRAENSGVTQLQNIELSLIPKKEEDPRLDTRPRYFQIVREDVNNRYVISGVSDGDTQELSGYVNDDRSLNIVATEDFPITFSMEGSAVQSGDFDVLIDDIFIDATKIPRLVDIGFLSFTGGVCQGSIYVVGNSSKVEGYGIIEARDVRLFTTYVPKEIGPVDTFLVLQEHELRILRTYAYIDEGEGAYFDGHFNIQEGILTDYAININVPESSLAPFRYDFDVVEIDALASGDIMLSGSGTFLNVVGDLVGESGQLIATQTIRGAAANRRPTMQQSLDIQIEVGAQFEVLWPSEVFPVLRIFPEQGASVILRTDAEGVIIPAGEVVFRSGEIFYFDRNFLIQEGSFMMNIIDERFDPLINVRAELREYGQRGPVSLFLIIEDDFLSQLSPRLEASPPLSQAEIATILGGNIIDTAPGSSEDAARSAVNLAGDVLSRFVVLNDFERTLRETLSIFDIITIRTQLLQNVIYNILEASDVTSSQNIARYFNNTDLFLGRYFADRLFFQLQFGLRTNEQNEYYGGALADLTLETSLSFEFQSPLGALSWGLSPQFEDQFSVENTVGFIWSERY